jgi:hypothetical protein
MCGIALVKPSDQGSILYLFAQAAIDLYSCGFKETHKSVETRSQVGCLQGLQSSGKKAIRHGVN